MSLVRPSLSSWGPRQLGERGYAGKGQKILDAPGATGYFYQSFGKPVHGCFAGRSTAGKTQIRDTRKRDD
jgi:hypothetical protein